MGQASSVLSHGTSIVSADVPSPDGTNVSSEKQTAYEYDYHGDDGQYFSTDMSTAITQDKNAALNKKRFNTSMAPFGPVSLATILTPIQAANLLGEATTRRIARAYRRTIILSLSVSSSTHNYSQNGLQRGNQLHEVDGYASDEYDQDENEEEACDLDDVMELFFPSDSTDSTDSTGGVENAGDTMHHPAPPSPHHHSINDAHSNWFSPQYGIDKISFPKLILPHHANPPLGVMDCIFNALTAQTIPLGQRSSNGYKSNSNYASTTSTNKIHLPDLIIFFAIFLHGSLELQATMAFRVYDSLQKQTTISRDTLNRFVAAVYSNERAESPLTKQILDKMMSPQREGLKGEGNKLMTASVGKNLKVQERQDHVRMPLPLLKELDLAQFVRGIIVTSSLIGTDEMLASAKSSEMKTTDTESISKTESTSESSTPVLRSHFLIVWLQKLCRSMLPDASKLDSQLSIFYKISPSSRISRSLSSKKNHAAVNAKLKNLYKEYKMSKMMQFECKRKFHSICSTNIGKLSVSPVTSSNSTDSTDEVVSTEEDSKSDKELSNEMNEQKLQKQHPHQKQHYHAINLQTFYSAISDPTEEMGWGGYLPLSLARRVFQHGCQSNHTLYGTNSTKLNRMNGWKEEWTLSDAISFACLSLREQSDEKLLKFCFEMFYSKSQQNHNNSTHPNKVKSDLPKTQTLNRMDLQEVILSILDHASYRRERDGHLLDVENDIEEKSRSWWYHQEDQKEKIQTNLKNQRNKIIFVDSSTAVSLQLISSDSEIHKGAIFLDALVDFALEKAGEENEMTFEGFKKWNIETGALRLIVLELKLIAGVVFGIRPSAPVQEFILVDEIRRRFKTKHPISQTMRRGRDGTVWYILSTAWWKKWMEYSSPAMRQVHRNRNAQNVAQKGSVKHLPGRPVITTPSSPGEIDNNTLLAQGSLALRRNISFKTDFELVPPLVWQALQAWHDGGPPIHRIVTVTNNPANQDKENTVAAAEIELYPFFLTIALADLATGQPRPFQQCVPVSKFKPMYTLVENLCKSLQYATKDVTESARLWMVNTVEDGGEEIHLLDLHFSLRDQKVNQTRVDGSITMLILELRNNQGEWPRGNFDMDDGNEGAETESDEGIEDQSSKIGDGIVGLYNMGNTCYLNSSIQCLSHTPLLRQYFTSKAYLKDINTTNIFGHQGRLAQVSAVLINQLWKPHSQTRPKLLMPSNYSNSSVPLPCPSLTPKSFKEAIGKFNDHFSGNEQHDAQELLSYLLGGLSEDLNRIESKPYIEQPDSDGRPDKELADIWWRNHLLREMSIIVALFTGQYKSLLTCKVCRYESARFEPFMYLQLPLPEDDLITISVILFPLGDSNKVLKYSVRIRQDGCIKDVLIELSRILYHEELDKSIDGKDKNTDDTLADYAEVDEEEGEEEDGEDDDEDDDEDDEEDDEEDDDEDDDEEIEGEDEDEDESSPSSESSEDDESDSRDNEERKIITSMADNMAVAEVRDCHVRSITPPTRTLSEMQSRDTGEIPLLFVYELEPTQPKRATILSKSKKEKNSLVNQVEKEKRDDAPGQQDKPTSSRSAYIAIAQRKLELLPHPFLHQFFLRTFDTPLLLRIPELDCYTGKDLYDLVARRISRFTPGHSIAGLLDLAKKNNKHNENMCLEEGQAPMSINGRGKKREQTIIDMETVLAGPIPRYGFRLRITSRDCKRCSLCPWFECCIGCVIPDDDYPTIVKDGDSITLDWHALVYNVFQSEKNTKRSLKKKHANDFIKSQSQVLETIENHGSCKENNFAGGSITLEECLDAFAKEERIPEAYCSKCKDFRVSTKRMSLWRLPPVMIIHLKRFQFTQHMKRKLRNLVVFPIEGLDFSRIVAHDNSTDASNKKDNEADDVINVNSDSSMGDSKDNLKNDHTTPDVKDFSTTCDGRSESLYDLYGVVHHQGALSTGHYVASLRSETDGKWRLFNDAQVYELDSKEVVDASAYILFYVRRDVKSAELSSFWDTSSRDGEGLTEEQIDKLTKQRERCSIS